MRNLSDFGIKFDRSVAVYALGETVSGKVFFSLLAPKSIRGDRQTTLPAGQHSYPFSFQLPVEIPCSFEHKNGYIQYTVEAVLDKSWSFDNKIVTPLTVLAPYSLSIQQKFATPTGEEFEEEFLHFCCFNAGLMRFDVSSHTRGFRPGEMIKLVIRYDGSSTRVNITRMRLVLLKEITFYALSNKKRKMEYLREVNRTGSFGRKGETSLRLLAPPLPPSNLQHWSIMDVNYELVLFIEVSGTHSNVTRSYPVHLWDTSPIR